MGKRSGGGSSDASSSPDDDTKSSLRSRLLAIPRWTNVLMFAMTIYSLVLAGIAFADELNEKNQSIATWLGLGSLSLGFSVICALFWGFVTLRFCANNGYCTVTRALLNAKAPKIESSVRSRNSTDYSVNVAQAQADKVTNAPSMDPCAPEAQMVTFTYYNAVFRFFLGWFLMSVLAIVEIGTLYRQGGVTTTARFGSPVSGTESVKYSFLSTIKFSAVVVSTIFFDAIMKSRAETMIRGHGGY